MTKDKIISRAITKKHDDSRRLEIDRCLEKIDDIKKYPDKYPDGALKATQERLKALECPWVV